jgi:hypothetical protein
MLPLWARGAAVAGAQEQNSIPASKSKAVSLDNITKKVEKVNRMTQLCKF